MLLEIFVENFKSFAEKQIFKTYANGTGNIANSTFNANYIGQNGKLKNIKLYKTSVIYGLNNSGKSNFIKAIDYINYVVRNSWQLGLPNKQESQYFRLEPKYKNKPSIFGIVFIAEDNIKYEYTFSIDNIQVYNEKLIAFPKGQSKLYFERKFNNKTGKYDYDTQNLIGNSKIQIEGIIGDTRNDCLFLSTAIKYGNEFLKPATNFLARKLHFLPNFVLDGILTNTYDIINYEDFKNTLKNILNDKNLVDIVVKNKELSLFQQQMLEKELENTPIEQQNNVKNHYENYKKHIFFIKKDINGEIIEDFFDIKKTESRGTNALLNLLTFIFLIKKENGGVLFFDELDASLHPKMLILLIKLMYKLDCNIQLIFTAHNTALLKKQFDVFRKYQVWFVDKDYNGGSVLYSAGDTSVRKEKDLEELYFNGRFSDMPDDDIIDNIK